MKARALVALSLIVALTIVVVVYPVMHTTFPIRNRARVKGVGVGIFWDENCTRLVDEIDWGMIEPNETKATLLYIRSRSNVNITLSLTTQNWSPENASLFITLSWNYTDTPLAPKSVTPTELYLHVAHNTTGIDHFSFDITIMASG